MSPMRRQADIARDEAPRRRGIVLILLSGLVATFLLVAMTLLTAVRSGTQTATARMRFAQATLLCESGMSYAASRLTRDPFPRAGTGASGRGDDWTFRGRGLAPFEREANPSYSHGEAWADGGDGVCGSAEPIVDRDADGRHDGVSGRLRAAGLSRGAGFSLRVEAAAGKIPLNAGYLDAQDRNIWDSDGPDHDDLLHPNHKGLAHAINNLGAIVRPVSAEPPGGWTRRKDVPGGADEKMDGTPDGEPIEVSWLGFDLLSRRPEGGFKTLAEVEETLLAAGYAQEEADLFLPHLDVGPHDFLPRSDRSDHQDVTFLKSGIPPVPPMYAPVELETASPEVLEAVWRYLQGPVYGLPGHPFSWRKIHGRSGSMTYEGTDPTRRTMICTIYPEEAAALASEVQDLRAKGPASWNALRDRLITNAKVLFARDWADLSSPPPPPLSPGPVEPARSAWVRAKADFSFYAVSVDPSPWHPIPGGWATGGKDLQVAGFGDMPFSAVICRFVSFSQPPSVPYPDGLDNDGDDVIDEPDELVFLDVYAPAVQRLPYGWAPPSSSWLGGPGNMQLIAPLGFTDAPPVRFDVACEGRLEGASGRAAAGTAVSGRLQASERLELTSQEDFDTRSPAASPSLDRLDILPVSFDPTEACAWLSDNGRTYPHVASYPYPHATVDMKALSRCYGGLALAGRETGLSGSLLYFPLRDDRDGNPANDFWGEPLGSPFSTQYRTVAPGIGSAGTTPWGVYDRKVFRPPVLHNGGDQGAAAEIPTPFTVEAWLLPPSSSGPGTADKMTVLSLTGDVFNNWGGGVIGAYIRMHAYHRVDSTLGPCVRFELQVHWPNNVPVAPPKVMKAYDLPDGSGGGAQRGFSHHVISLEPVAGPPQRTVYRWYVNGTLAHSFDYPDSGVAMPMTQAHWMNLLACGTDEIRFYDTGMLSAGVQARYQLGRFAVPASVPASDPQDLLKALPDEPPNPVYRSPRWDCGTGSSLGMAAWTGYVPPPLSGKVGMRLLAFGFDGAGSCTGWREIPRAGEAADLSGLGAFRSFRLAVEFHRKPGLLGSVAPLYDTPVFESVWLTLRRPERSPRWSAWRAE